VDYRRHRASAIRLRPMVPADSGRGGAPWTPNIQAERCRPIGAPVPRRRLPPAQADLPPSSHPGLANRHPVVVRRRRHFAAPRRLHVAAPASGPRCQIPKGSDVLSSWQNTPSTFPRSRDLTSAAEPWGSSGLSRRRANPAFPSKSASGPRPVGQLMPNEPKGSCLDTSKATTTPPAQGRDHGRSFQ
jgi:hypothetical protein